MPTGASVRIYQQQQALRKLCSSVQGCKTQREGAWTGLKATESVIKIENDHLHKSLASFPSISSAPLRPTWRHYCSPLNKSSIQRAGRTDIRTDHSDSRHNDMENRIQRTRQVKRFKIMIFKTNIYFTVRCHVPIRQNNCQHIELIPIRKTRLLTLYTINQKYFISRNFQLVRFESSASIPLRQVEHTES